MHVIDWVKRTQQMRAHTSSRARLQRLVNVLKQRVQDTQMLMKHSPSTDAAKLAQATQSDLAEAQGQLQRKDRKLEKLKKDAAEKKAHAAKLTKLLAAKTGKKAKSKAKTGNTSKSSKAAKLVKLQKVAAVKKAHAAKLTKMLKQQKSAKMKAMKAKAHGLAIKAAKLNEKAHSAEADVTVLKKKAA